MGWIEATSDITGHVLQGFIEGICGELIAGTFGLMAK